MYIRNNNGLKTDSCRTPAKMFFQEDVCPFKRTRRCQSLRSLVGNFSHLPSMPYICNLNIKPSGRRRGGLSGNGNLRSDFDHSNLFQSLKQLSINNEHQVKSKLA